MNSGPIELLFRSSLLQWLNENRPTNAARSARNRGIALATSQNTRDENEDRAFYAEFESPRADRCFSLAAVLDGIGGLSDGSECADLAISAILAKLIVPRKSKHRLTLMQALLTANDEIRMRYSGRAGATFAGVFAQQKRVTAVNVGDSRVYLFDPSRGGLKQVSVDDRLGHQIAKVKGFENIALNPELASRLGQFLGMQDLMRPNVRTIDSASLRSEVGYLVLLTDGAYASGESFLTDVLGNYFEPPQIVSSVVNNSATLQHADNATLICAKANQLTVPVPIRGEYGSYERIQVWTTEGNFAFVIPPSVSADQKNPVQRQPNRRQQRRRDGADEKARDDKPSNQRKEKTKRDVKSESPKRELLIQQLNFETDDETAG